MSNNLKKYFAWIVTMTLIISCSVSGSNLSEKEKLETAVALTLEVINSNQDDTPAVALPTITTAPTNTVENQPTSTPEPCNLAKFVSETVEDGADYSPNQSFTKTWRLKNIGTCTWNTNYKLVFFDGDKMSGPSSKNLTQSVSPGEQVDISVDLKAPAAAGTYKGFWKIADDEGQYYVNTMWVEIDVIEPAAPPPAKADLIVTEFSLNPPTPISHNNVHTRVKVKNQGGTDAGGFKVQWYGLTTSANPACDWNIVGGLAAGDSVLVECDYTYLSWYPHDKTTIVYVDVDDTVDESNEGNNTASISPFGVDP